MQINAPPNTQPNVNENSTNSTDQNSPRQSKYMLKIFQWNACSLNPEKRAQLELLSSKNKYDILCISELGSYRKITGFPNYYCSDTDTQSGIFWRDGLNVEKILIDFEDQQERIMTQIINVNSELLIVHTYIAPELNHTARSKY